MEIATHCRCSPLKISDHYQELMELEKRRLLRREVNDHTNGQVYIELYVPQQVCERLLSNEPEIHDETRQADVISFFQQFNAIIEHKKRGYLTYDEMRDDILDLMARHDILPFVKQLQLFALEDEELFLLIFLCHQYISGETRVDMVSKSPPPTWPATSTAPSSAASSIRSCSRDPHPK
jgi:hypothetical protein